MSDMLYPRREYVLEMDWSYDHSNTEYATLNLEEGDGPGYEELAGKDVDDPRVLSTYDLEWRWSTLKRVFEAICPAHGSRHMVRLWRVVEAPESRGSRLLKDRARLSFDMMPVLDFEDDKPVTVRDVKVRHVVRAPNKRKQPEIETNTGHCVFVVNTGQIVEADGNAQGIQLDRGLILTWEQLPVKTRTAAYLRLLHEVEPGKYEYCGDMDFTYDPKTARIVYRVLYNTNLNGRLPIFKIDSDRHGCDIISCPLKLTWSEVLKRDGIVGGELRYHRLDDAGYDGYDYRGQIKKVERHKGKLIFRFVRKERREIRHESVGEQPDEWKECRPDPMQCEAEDPQEVADGSIAFSPGSNSHASIYPRHPE